MPLRVQDLLPFVVGLTSFMGLIGFYLGLMTLTGGWQYPLA